LTPDGRIQFVYAEINGTESIVGISPGGITEPPDPHDLSTSDGLQARPGAIAEVFTSTTNLDLVAVAQRFYQSHDDSYQILLVFTTFNFNLNGAFAFEINISNDVTGIGMLGTSPTFDFSDDFGSSRLESMLNLGNLSKYPANPSEVFLRGVDSTLSVIGHEAGHRFLSYVRFRDPETNTSSTGLLGRDFQHWSFFFNSDASLLEGNRIRDNGNGTFTTIGAVEHYSDLDQYIMGLRSPEEVPPSFLVKDPGLGFSPGTAPASQPITFSGRRVNVTIDDVIAANGLRSPNHVTARKRFNFAFVLVTPRGVHPTDSQMAHLDRIRREWVPYFAEATSFRGIASAALLRFMQIKPEAFGMPTGARRQLAIELAEATGTNRAVAISNSNPAAVAGPSQVIIPAGSTSGLFTVVALDAGGDPAAGRAVLTASSPGFETVDLVVQVVPHQQTADLSLEVTGGDEQIAPPGAIAPLPLQVSLRDVNRIPYPGQSVTFSVIEGDATVSPGISETDAEGRAESLVQFGATTGPVIIRAVLSGTTLAADFFLAALDAPQVPQLATLNAASYALSPLFQPGVATSSPGALISIFGTNLAASTAAATSSPLPRNIGGTSVEIGGLLAPLLYVSPNQINAQVPFELAPSVLTLQVRNPAGDAAPIFFAVQETFPGIFSFDASGQGSGAILHNDTNLPVTAEDPALPGESVQIFATGLGSVSPAIPSGQPAGSEPPSATVLPARVLMNGTPATVVFAGLAPGFPGLYQVNVAVPELEPGVAEVSLTIGGVASPPVTIAVGSR
jgi:uncharacterized protein (TIGR03437 family)